MSKTMRDGKRYLKWGGVCPRCGSDWTYLEQFNNPDQLIVAEWHCNVCGGRKLFEKSTEEKTA